jgi:Zn-dependent peptidase ImmA (M78 family)
MMRRTQRAIREARRVLEQHGISSAPVDVESLAKQWAHVVKQNLREDISGMLVPLPNPVDQRQWAIVVNKAHSVVRQRFTIAHELAHLLLHGYTAAHADRGFKVRLRDSHSAEGSVLEEIEANNFAAELLMPEPLLRERLQNHTIDYAPDDPSSEQQLARLAREFNVSKQALSIRLSGLIA